MEPLKPVDPRGELKKARHKGSVVDESGLFLRKPTKLHRHTFNYFLQGGGLGDYICQMPVFEYMAENMPHVDGRLYARPPFLEVAEYIMKPWPKWKVYNIDDAPKIMQKGEFISSPTKYHKYINPCGAHLMDLGFMYYLNMDRPPQGYGRMPDLTGYCSGKDWGLPKDYAVMTPGYTCLTRATPAWAFNDLCQYLLSLGITPVFLGREHFADADGGYVAEDYHAKIGEGVDLSQGINLMEKTSLLEAVEIMRGAKIVLGVDNGLLHFAACTEVPIIFGMTITIPRHRWPRRARGDTEVITVRPEKLSCIGCQSKVRSVVGSDFKYCLYGDYLCTEALFENECADWKNAIDILLEDF